MGEKEIVKYCLKRRFFNIAQARKLVRQYHKLKNKKSRKSFLTFLSERLEWDAQRTEQVRRALQKAGPGPGKLASDAVAAKDSTEKDHAESRTFFIDADGNIEFDIPEVIDCYRLLKKQGEGGAGVVYKAQHEETGEIVAIKILQQPPGEEDPQAVQRFAQEIKHHLELDHPNIVKALSWGLHEECLYLVMEFIDGMDLDTMIEKFGRLSPKRALSLAIPVAAALEYALSLRIVHRDLKPANILLNPVKRQVKLADIGLGKTIQTSGLTLSGVTIGSPYFMAPEQVEHFSEVDHRADLYSLGATLYYMLSGIFPFDDRTPYQVMMCKLEKMEPEPLEQLVPDLPPAVVKLVNKAMAHQIDKRFQTPTAFREAMEKVLATLVQEAR